MTDITGIAKNQPLYLYQKPMFMLTVSVVLVIENGVVVVTYRDQDKETESLKYRFPCGEVRAGQESIQFAAVRHVYEQTGIVLKKDLLFPVDFRSDPERAIGGNIVDIGMVCIMDKLHPDYPFKQHEEVREIESVRWMEVDFVEKNLLKDRMPVNDKMYMDHSTLLGRAIDAVWIAK
jgi:8-oxo-dGTP pyrophosphatase MutT (NUDIX family)